MSPAIPVGFAMDYIIVRPPRPTHGSSKFCRRAGAGPARQPLRAGRPHESAEETVRVPLRATGSVGDPKDQLSEDRVELGRGRRVDGLIEVVPRSVVALG